MSLYTKTGDNGETSLLGGKRVSKSSPIVESIGNIDELNSTLGLIVCELQGEVRTAKKFTEVITSVKRIQKWLFVLGGDIACVCCSEKQFGAIPKIVPEYITVLESEMDLWEKELPQQKHFLLPSGSKAALFAYQSRAICRRAERSIVIAAESFSIDPVFSKFINRLSDWLFMCFRMINHISGQKEDNVIVR